MQEALIIFVRRPQPGKVKTRIAAAAGNDVALQVYQKLLHHTCSITQFIAPHKFVFYADAVDNNDIWSREGYSKEVQQEGNLGYRMQQAFAALFEKGYEKIAIIGSDCFELTTGILNQAFHLLNKHDVVLGPATDGGYYLLAMRHKVQAVFHPVDWSTEKVLEQTLDLVQQQQLSYALLPSLTDIDTVDDLPESWKQAFHLTPVK